MTIPLSFLLIIYLIFVAVFIIFAIINIHHITMSASVTPTSLLVIFFVLAAGFFTIYGTFYMLRDVNWQARVDTSTGSVSSGQPDIF